MHRQLLYLLVGILFASASISYAAPAYNDDLEQQLNRLDNELNQRHKYIESRQKGIDSLREVIDKKTTHNKMWLDNVLKLADRYNSFETDSALYYYSTGYDKAVDLGLDSLATIFRLKRATIYPVAGFIKNAIEEYQAIDTAGMSKPLKIQYLESGRQMYSYISSFYNNYPDEHDHYNRLALEAQMHLLDLLPVESALYKLNLGEYFFYRQEYAKARTVLEELLDELNEDDNMYARSAHILSDIAKSRGEHNRYLYYLTLSAIGDTRSATREVNSLQELGGLLFTEGDIDRAHSYLLIALENAVECNAAMRMIQTAEVMPIIEEAHKAELEKERNRIYVIIGMLALLLIALVITLLFIRKEMKRMAELHNKLETANQVKEVYLSQFLSLCSIYMDKLNQFCKIANRKISAGKVDDLYKMTKSGKFVEEQSREFYEVFDDAFLHIYPSFVKSVNALLRSDEKIILADGEKLNTDLRILAFMRLGIVDSGKIAQVLNYSVNTIYTYRNKLRNKAINRENFETDIMKISSIN